MPKQHSPFCGTKSLEMSHRGGVWGLTGGIATGKSTAAQFLEKRGCHVIDTDAIAHRLMEPDQINWQKIVDEFGKSVLNADRTINRRVLGDLIFDQPRFRQRLNSLTHPAIREAWQSERRQFLKAHPGDKLIIMIPLLFEVKLEKEFDAILCVGCSLATQVRRLLMRGLAESVIQKRIASQIPVADKLRLSQYVIWNEGTLRTLEQQVEQLFVYGIL